jgi:formamidopyrimidine-DNA glycosylase
MMPGEWSCQGLHVKVAPVPELPDITIYLEALERRILDRVVTDVRVTSPFLLRTAVPPIQTIKGHRVTVLRSLGKRIVIGMEGDLWLVLHLMIAGRLHWRDSRVSLSGRHSLAALDFANGTLLLTEAGTRKRASLHLFQRNRACALWIRAG